MYCTYNTYDTLYDSNTGNSDNNEYINNVLIQ